MHFPRLRSIITCLTISAALLTACGGPPRDFLLVIDSSGSMAVGEDDTIGKVKDAVGDFLERVRNGDTVTLITFATEPQVSRTYEVQGPEDREVIAADVRALTAEGRWTDMGAMMLALRQKTRELASDSRDLVVVVMSDGEDDPPPGVQREDVDLAEYRDPAQAEEGGADFIYYLSLGKLQDPELEEDLGELASDEGQVRTIQSTGNEASQGEAGDADGGTGTSDEAGAASGEGAEDGDEIGLSEAMDDVEQTSWNRMLLQYGWIALIILAVILLALLIWFLIKKLQNRHKLQGLLRYYEADVGQPVKNDFGLDKLDKSSMTIGSKLGADLRLRQSGLPQNVTVKAKPVEGEMSLIPRTSDQAFFQFQSQKREGVISKGDRFKLGNFMIEYDDGGNS